MYLQLTCMQAKFCLDKKKKTPKADINIINKTLYFMQM